LNSRPSFNVKKKAKLRHPRDPWSSKKEIRSIREIRGRQEKQSVLSVTSVVVKIGIGQIRGG
jgi:hypothetical protein